MKLLTAEVRKRLPALGSQELVPNPCVPVKFFDPCGSWGWYCIEFDGEDTFFGYVHGFEDELGYFTMSDLLSVKGPLGLGIERDIHWDPKTTLSQVKSGERR